MKSFKSRYWLQYIMLNDYSQVFICLAKSIKIALIFTFYSFKILKCLICKFSYRSFPDELSIILWGGGKGLKFPDGGGGGGGYWSPSGSNPTSYEQAVFDGKFFNKVFLLLCQFQIKDKFDHACWSHLVPRGMIRLFTRREHTHAITLS